MNSEYCWHIHHDELCEQIKEPIEKRIEYIKTNKPQHEIELRLRLLNPVKSERVISEMEKIERAKKAYDEEATAPSWKIIEEEHKKECVDCPWDGKSIFRKTKTIL